MTRLVTLLVSLSLGYASLQAQTPAPAPTLTPPPAAPVAAVPIRALPALDLLLDKDIVALFATLPVQESGRIKPLDNVASYRLLRFNGIRSIAITDTGKSDGKPLLDPATSQPLVNAKGKAIKLSPMQWLLVCWFRPDIARAMPMFIVDNSSAIAELGLDTKAKRDRYAFNDLAAARATLMEKMSNYRELPVKKQSPEQRIIVQLASNFLDFEMTAGHFDFIRSPLGDTPKAMPAGIEASTPEKPLRLSASLKHFVAALKTGGPPMQQPWFRELGKSALGAMMSGNGELQLRIFPPTKDAKSDVWGGPGESIFKCFTDGSEPSAEDSAWLAMYEDLYLALPDAGKFKTAATALKTKITTAAAARGEGQWVALEEHSMKADYFFYGQWLFLVGLICVALTWPSPLSKFAWVAKACAWLFIGSATALVTTGIVIRCIIMQRPPITTLYETMLFIGTVGSLFGLIAEVLTRRGLGLLIAGLAGYACFFMAIGFEASEANDSLQLLQAVLITNFWLATHVPMINMGYAASMVAAIVSMVYFVQRLFGKLKPGNDDARFFTRMSYGFLGAGLFLSLVGTVLGGIWANYSWGRFWGWDPKENGALMIVLMTLAILHARMGGFIREAGLHCCNLVLGMIVIFSWFAVNQLGVGLHAYGFTDGTWPKIHAFWASQLLLIGYGLWCSRKDRNRGKAASQPAIASAVPAAIAE